MLQFVHQLGRVRANEVYLLSPVRRSPVSRAGGNLQGRPRCARLVCAPAHSHVGERGVHASRRRSIGRRSAAVACRARCLGRHRAHCDRGRRHARRRECGRVLAGGARVQAHPHHRGRIGAPAARRPRVSAAAARRVPRPRSSAAPSTAWRRRSRTRCWLSVRRATRRRASRSAARWPRSPTSASKRNGG